MTEIRTEKLTPGHAFLLTSLSRDLAITPRQGEEVVTFKANLFDTELAEKVRVAAASVHTTTTFIALSFHTMSHVAQNSLLKVLEEPLPHIKFVLITSAPNLLLPTLLSRLSPVTVSEDEGGALQLYAQKFLHTREEERMSLPFIEEILTKKDEEERKDREGIHTFLVALLDEVAKKGMKGETLHRMTESIKFLSLPGSSPKVIMEYLALLLPRV